MTLCSEREGGRSTQDGQDESERFLASIETL